MTRIIRDFRTLVELVARGRLVEKLDREVGELLAALDAAGDDGKASLTLTLTLQRVGDKTDVRAAVKTAPPADKPLPAATLFNAEGGLSLQHPSQIDLFAGPRDASSKQA